MQQYGNKDEEKTEFKILKCHKVKRMLAFRTITIHLSHVQEKPYPFFSGTIQHAREREEKNLILS